MAFHTLDPERLGHLVDDLVLAVGHRRGGRQLARLLGFSLAHLLKRSTLAEMLEEEVGRQLELQKSPEYRALPSGAVHADLFRNNALISRNNGGEESLAGVIDFYFACNAPFLYDLAVTLNDWTIDLETGEFEPERSLSMLQGYNSVRHLTEEDHKLWQDILSAAALRFWVSRLYDYYMPRPASLLTPHDPAHFERILKLRRESAPEDLPWI